MFRLFRLRLFTADTTVRKAMSLAHRTSVCSTVCIRTQPTRTHSLKEKGPSYFDLRPAKCQIQSIAPRINELLSLLWTKSGIPSFTTYFGMNIFYYYCKSHTLHFTRHTSFICQIYIFDGHNQITNEQLR